MRIVPTDKAELKAVLFALFVCGLFLGVVIANQGPRRIKKRVHAELMIPPPMAPTQLLEPEAPPPPPFNQRFRVVSKNFKNVDFRNRSYGVYTYPNGRTIDLRLSNGELAVPDPSGFFALRDVYYRDVTGDSVEEAIVRLSQITCKRSCDAVADLFYIYAMRHGKLTTIWQYETGSLAYGCGLKSFTAGKQLVLELFGDCPKQGTNKPGTAKFVVQDLTYILFNFNGQRFEQEAIEFFSTPSTRVKNHEPPIHLF